MQSQWVWMRDYSFYFLSASIFSAKRKNKFTDDSLASSVIVASAWLLPFANTVKFSDIICYSLRFCGIVYKWFKVLDFWFWKIKTMHLWSVFPTNIWNVHKISQWVPSDDLIWDRGTWCCWVNWPIIEEIYVQFLANCAFKYDILMELLIWFSNYVLAYA